MKKLFAAACLVLFLAGCGSEGGRHLICTKTNESGTCLEYVESYE